jgi:hypothetical protein
MQMYICNVATLLLITYYHATFEELNQGDVEFRFIILFSKKEGKRTSINRVV